MMSKTTERDTHIDMLKGFLVLLMAVGHIPYRLFGLERGEFMTHLSHWIYFFHMPLFLVISVLFIKDNYRWMGKRALLILLPYVFWFLYNHKLLLVLHPLQFMTDILMGNWSTLNSTLWFLPALFSLNILVFLYHKIPAYGRYLMLLISLGCFVLARQIMLIHHHVPFGIDIAGFMLLLAYLTRTIYTQKETWTKAGSWLLLLLIATSSGLIFLCEPLNTRTRYHTIIDLAQYSVPVSIIGYIAFLILNLSVFILFLKLRNLKFLTTLGTYSFPVFLLHLKVLYEIPKLVHFNQLPLRLAFLFTIFVLSLVLPVIVSKVLMRISDKFRFIGMVK